MLSEERDQARNSLHGGSHWCVFQRLVVREVEVEVVEISTSSSSSSSSSEGDFRLEEARLFVSRVVEVNS